VRNFEEVADRRLIDVAVTVIDSLTAGAPECGRTRAHRGQTALSVPTALRR
jgi:hypothetical protein